MRSGTGRGRQGPGLLGATFRPAVLPGSPAPVSGRTSTQAPAAGAEYEAAHGRRHDQAPSGRQRVDFQQVRWLPRHQPWNAATVGGDRSRGATPRPTAVTPPGR